MKALAVLLLAHIVICGLAGYWFQELASQNRQEFRPAIETTTPKERARSERSFLMAREHRTYRFPTAVTLYALAGLLALLIAFGVELWQLFGTRA